MKEQLQQLLNENGAHGLFVAVLEVLKEESVKLGAITAPEGTTGCGGCPKNWICNTQIGQCVPDV